MSQQGIHNGVSPNTCSWFLTNLSYLSVLVTHPSTSGFMRHDLRVSRLTVVQRKRLSDLGMHSQLMARVKPGSAILRHRLKAFKLHQNFHRAGFCFDL